MMPYSSRDLWYALILTAILVSVILLALAFYQFLLEPVRKRREISRRLKGNEEYLQRIQILKERVEDRKAVSRLFEKILGVTRYGNLQVLMLQADIFQEPGKFWGQVLLLALLAFAGAAWLSGFFIVGFLTAGGVILLPFLYLKWRKSVKSARFERQMPDAMELMARSLRVGHTMPASMELLGEEMDDPIRTEMKIAYEEQKYGMSVSDSLLHMLERVDSMDLRYFVSAVLIQQETGGNLAELMESIARVIRSRLNFKAKLRGLTASARISAFIMIVTPILAFLGLMVIAPHYETILISSPKGRIMLMAGAGLAAMGSYMLRKLVRSIEV